jgi:hypothetical protein
MAPSNTTSFWRGFWFMAGGILGLCFGLLAALGCGMVADWLLEKLIPLQPR